MKQLSAFPEEKPDLEILVKIKKKTVRGFLCSYLRAKGPYGFAKLWEAIRDRDNVFFLDKTGFDKETVLGSFNGVFGDMTAFTITIEDFLSNLKRIPNYRLPGFCDDNLKSIR